ncbi:MAG: hypothetical protein R6V45_04680 [Oceanipulchritudo sp.]
MRRFFLAGGFIGFLLTFVTSLSTNGNLNLALRDGMIGCLLLGLVSKLFYRQLESAAVAILEREIAAAEEEKPKETE